MRDRRVDHLTPDEIRVINQYILGVSQEDALEAGGYHREYKSFFQRPIIKAEIAHRKQRMVWRNKANEDWVMQRLMAIAGGSLGECIELDNEGQPFFDWTKLTPEMKSALSGVEVEEFKDGKGKGQRDKVRLKLRQLDQLRALEMIGKQLGMFKEKIEISTEQSLIDKLIEGRLAVAKPSDREVLEQPNPEGIPHDVSQVKPE